MWDPAAAVVCGTANRNANGNGNGNVPRSPGRMRALYDVPAVIPRREISNGRRRGTPEGAVAGTAPRTLPVLIQHEEDPMNRTLAALDREWADLDRSAASANALERWGEAERALAGLPTLAAVLAKRTDPDAAPEVLAALARLAVADTLAARTLLQALVPGLVRMATTSCGDDPAALDELVSLAWERVRTYPSTRPGSVAANVLWDVRKRYREHRAVETPASLVPELRGRHEAPSAEEVVLSGHGIRDELMAAHRSGVISDTALTLIVRTRLDEVPLEVVAAEQRSTPAYANCVRWRAERRLRPVLAIAS
jgi:hypothetical protein